MVDPTGDVLQRSVERLGLFARTAFGVELRLSAPGDAAPQTASPEAPRTHARPVRCARTGDRLLLAQPPPAGDPRSPSVHGQEGDASGCASTHLLNDFLDLAAELLGNLADSHSRSSVEPLREQLWKDLLGTPTIVGVSAPAHALRTAIAALANSREPLFLSGEPGSGRREVAAAVHRAGPHAAGPFIAENLAVIPETLREAELFGADDTPGLLAAAAGGTIFLAAVDQLSDRAQERLLGHLSRVGTAAGAPPPARVIATADAQLGEAALRGRFRRDLAGLLTTLKLAVPTLRERPEDIPLIAIRLLCRHAEALGETPPKITPDALDSLKKRSWAGNVRELDEELARAASGRTVIRVEDLAAVPPRTGRRETAAPGSLLRQAVYELETGLLSQALADTNWNKSRAARILGLSRLGLQKKIDRYGIDRRR